MDDDKVFERLLEDIDSEYVAQVQVNASLEKWKLNLLNAKEIAHPMSTVPRSQDNLKPFAFTSLPLEIRRQIYNYLLVPETPHTILRPLFIRHLYRTIFMTQQTKNICTSLLLLNREISCEALTVLYGQVSWRAACRLDQLASQIGMDNFARITKLAVDHDDLIGIRMSLRADLEEARSEVNQSVRKAATMFVCGKEVSRRLRFHALEVVEMDGYYFSALSEHASARTQAATIRLCKDTQEIVNLHPTLRYVVQSGDEETTSDGGSDARDALGKKVKWRLLAKMTDKLPKERIVDLSETIETMTKARQPGEYAGEKEKTQGYGQEEGMERSLPRNWNLAGQTVFRQYPYLPRSLVAAGLASPSNV